MRKVELENAVGKKLAHDIIEYGPNKKRVLFKRGYEFKKSDLEKMRDTGNYFVYVTKGEEKGVHEDEAATRMAKATSGENLFILNPTKSRVRVLAKKPGLLKTKTSVIKKVNMKEPFIIASKNNNKGVRKKEEVASLKIAPLVVKEGQMKDIENILEQNKPVIEVVPPKAKKIGLIITGTEVYEGRIEDAFEPTLKEKLDAYNLDITKSIILPDDKSEIKEKIREFTEKSFDLIFVTGGMAVDSDDVTPDAIKETGADIISRSTPIFPGNMLMTARLENSIILGTPACVLPDKETSLDTILPMALAKENLTKENIAELSNGGLL